MCSCKCGRYRATTRANSRRCRLRRWRASNSTSASAPCS
jgi:hypothetical protein